MTLRISVESRLQDVSRAAWDALIDRCPHSTVFQTYGWIEAWLRTVGTEITDIRIVTAHRGVELVGVAPMWHGTHRNLESRRPTTQFLGLWHSDYHLFPARDAAADIVNALLDELDRTAPPNTPIVLSEVPEHSSLAAALRERASMRSAGVILKSVTPCPRLEIRGNEAVVARVLRKESLRRHESALRRRGELTVEHLTDAAAIEPLLASFFEQHVQRWAQTRHPSLFTRDYNRRFYQSLLSELAGTGHILYSVVRVDGRPVAHHFGLRSRGDLLWYKPAFDVQYRRCSPGEVLLKSLIVHARETGLAALDFTRGVETFKERFASGVNLNGSYEWARGSWQRTVATFESSARTVARRLLKPLRRVQR